jgi:TP901 family phage tail tape measure protein
MAGIRSASGDININVAQAAAAVSQLQGGLVGLGNTQIGAPNAGGFNSAMTNAQNVTRGFGDQVMGLERELNVAGAGLIGFGGVITGAFVLGGKSAADFEEQMSGLEAIMGSEQWGSFGGEMRDLALTLGKETSFGANDAALAITELSKAGISAENIMNGAAEGVVLLAEASGTDLVTAAGIASVAMNQFGLAGEDMGRIADILTNGANKSSASVESLGQGLTYVGATANTLGIPLEDTIAALSALTDRGLDASTAGTSLNHALTSIINPTGQAKTAMDELGLSMGQANSLINEDGSFKSLTEIIENVDAATKDLTETERQRYIDQIFGIQGGRAINALLDTQSEASKEAGKSWQDYMDAIYETGTAQEQAKVRMDNLKGSIEELKGTIEVIAIEVMSRLLPALKAMTDFLGAALGVFLDLPAPIQTTIAALVGLTGASSLLLGAFLLALPKMVEFSRALRILAAQGGLLGAFGKSAAGLARFVRIGMLALTGFGLAAVAFYAVYKTNLFGIGDITRDFVDGFTASWNTLRANGMNPVSAGLHSIERALLTVSLRGGAVGKAAKRLSAGFRDVANAADWVGDTFGTIWRTGEIVQGTFDFLPGPLEDVAHGFALVFDSVGDLTRAFQAGGLRGALAALPGEFSIIKTGLQEMASGLLEGAKIAAGWILDVGAPAVAGWIADHAGDAWEAIKTAAGWALEMAGNLGAWALDTAAPAIGGWIATAAGNVWEAIKTAAGWAWGGLANLGSWIMNTAAPKVAGWIKTAASGAWDAIKTAAGWSGTMLANLGSWLLNTAAPKVTGWIATAAGGVWEALKTITGWTFDLWVNAGDWAMNTTEPDMITGWLSDTAGDTWEALKTATGWNFDGTVPLGALTVTVDSIDWSDLSTKLVSGVQAVFEGAFNLGEGVGSLPDFAADIMEWVAREIDDVEWDEVGKAVPKLFAAGVVGAFAALTAIPGLAIAFGAGVFQGLVDVDWPRVGRAFVNLLDSGIGAANELIGGIFEGIWEMLPEGLSEAIARVMAQIRQMVNDIIVNLNLVISGINALSPGTAADIPLIPLLEGVGNKLKDVTVGAQAAGRALKDAFSLKPTVPETENGDAGAPRGDNGGGGGGGGGMFELEQFMSPTIFEPYIAGLANVTTAIGGAKNALVDLGSGAGREAMGALKAAYDANVPAISLGFQQTPATWSAPSIAALTAIKTGFTTVLPSLAATVSTQFNALKTAGVSSINALKTDVVTHTGTMASGSIKNASNMNSQSSQQAAAMKTAVANSFMTMNTTVATQMSIMKIITTAAFTEMASSSRNAATAISSAMQQGAARAAAGVRSGLSPIPGIVASVGNSAAGVARGIGANIGNAFAAGMRSALGSIAAAANAMVAAAQKALMAKAMISSPSRLFMELGMYTGQGYEQGILSTVPDVAAAGAALVQPPTPPEFFGGMRAGYGGAGSVTIIHDNRSFDIDVNESATPAATTDEIYDRLYQDYDSVGGV